MLRDTLMDLNLISGLKYILPLNREFFKKCRCYSISICMLLNCCSVIKKHFAKTCHAQFSVHFEVNLVPIDTHTSLRANKTYDCTMQWVREKSLFTLSFIYKIRNHGSRKEFFYVPNEKQMPPSNQDNSTDYLTIELFTETTS